MTWTADIITKACGEVDEGKYAVWIPQPIHDRFLTLIKEIKTEWLIYLPFEVVTQGNLTIYKVTGYIVPKQEVSGTAVKVLEPVEGEVGVIHAHQFSSSRFFSSTDDSHVNSNNAFSLVINKVGEYLAKTRIPTPCGKYLQLPCEVVVTFTQYEDIVDEINTHAVEKTYSYSQKGGSYNQNLKKSQQVWANKRSTDQHTDDRLVKECPNKEDVTKCENESYFDCQFFWADCPKKPTVVETPTIDDEEEETEQETEEQPTVETEIVPVPESTTSQATDEEEDPS